MKLCTIKKNIKDEIFSKVLKPIIVGKNLIKFNWANNKQIVNRVNNALIDLRKAVNEEATPKNENPQKVNWYCWKHSWL